MRRLIVLIAALIALPAMAHAETACADLTRTALPHARVTAAVEEAGLCRVSVTSTPTPDSDIRIEVWIPTGGAWNGRYVQMGNGGFAGRINSGPLKALAAKGYATAGTDNGHQSPIATSAAWALGHREKIVDFGWRSLKETTDVAKALIAAQKGPGIARSYFIGCSDGGREALMEAQRFPADFDGIVAGAPANNMSQLFGNGAAHQQALAAPGGYLAEAQLQLLQKAALADCGGEAFIRDPAACRFNPGKLLCKPGQTEGCLTAPQLASARAIYDGRRDPRTGKVAFPGYAPGAEDARGSWNNWITGPDRARNSQAAGYQFASNALKYFAFQDADFDFLKMDLGAEFDRGRAIMSPMIDSIDPDLSAFKARGGKLIQYHGWNDPAIPAASSIVYFEHVRARMGDVGGFYKLYLVPGMLHCGGGPGASSVDWLATLEAWVVGSQAPGDLIATGGPASAVPSQVLCPFPAVARKTGEAYACAAPRRSFWRRLSDS